MALVSHGAAVVQPLIAGRPAGRPHFYRRSGGAQSVTLSPDGRTLAVQTDGGIEIVDVARMRISGFLPDSDTTVTAPVFIGNGVVAAGSREGWVRMWSPATSRPVSPRLAAHSGAVVALAVSPDGHTLASGGTDGSVRLFDVDTQQPLAARLPVAPREPGVARSFRSTAPTYSRPRRRGMAIAGTSARPPGSGAPAPSPAATSRAASGATPSLAGNTPPCADPAGAANWSWDASRHAAGQEALGETAGQPAEAVLARARVDAAARRWRDAGEWSFDDVDVRGRRRPTVRSTLCVVRVGCGGGWRR